MGGGGQVTFDELEHGRIFFEHEMGGVATVIQDHVGLPVVGGDTSVDAPPEILLRLAAPREDRETCNQNYQSAFTPFPSDPNRSFL